MEIELDAAKLKAEYTYNAAADTYDAQPLSFWNRYGRRTVQRLGLRDGDKVLDVCCGTGASALPAAEIVGSRGKVVAIDLAEELLKLGRRRAATARLPWLDFRRGDMTELRSYDASFNAVICVFGVFFVADMEAQVRRLWRLVKPGGQLAITTWGPGMFSPAYDHWLAAVGRVRPDLCAAFNPWDRITTPDAVHQLFASAGICSVDVSAEAGHQPLNTPNDFWTIALGSGLRWIIEHLDADTARAVEREVTRKLTESGVDRVATNVIYAIAKRPSIVTPSFLHPPHPVL